MDFEQIYKEYFGDIYRYIRGLSGDEHIAEEVTCETFFKAMRNLSKFRGDCDIRVWLCKIAKNTYFSYLKNNKKSDSTDFSEQEHIPDSKINIEELTVEQDESERIKKILHDLSEPYKEVFMWRVYGELSFKHIGQLFGKNENWACVTYHRAKKLIREKMEEPYK